MILKTILGIALFISGGHIVSTNLKLHHYSDDDFKDIFYLKHNKSNFTSVSVVKIELKFQIHLLTFSLYSKNSPLNKSTIAFSSGII